MGKYITNKEIEQLLASEDEKTRQLGTTLQRAIGDKDTLDLNNNQFTIVQKYLNPTNTVDTTDTTEVVTNQDLKEPVWAADAKARTFKPNDVDPSKLPQNWEATSAKYRFGSEPYFDSKGRAYLRSSDGKILYYPDKDAYAGVFPMYKGKNGNKYYTKLYSSQNSDIVSLDTVPLSATKPSTYALWKTNSDADEISTEVDHYTRLAKNPELHGVDRTDNSNWLQGLSGFITGAVGLGGGTYLGGKVLYPVARKLWNIGLRDTPSMASYAIKDIGNKSIKTGILGGLAGLGNIAKAALTANPLSLTLSALTTPTEVGKGSDFKIRGKDGSIHDSRYEILTPEGNWVSKQSILSTPQSLYRDASKKEVQSYLDAFAKTKFSGNREKNYSFNKKKPIADPGYYIIGENGYLSFETEEQANAALEKLKQDSRYDPVKTRLLRVNKQGGKMNYKNYFKEGGRFIPKAQGGHPGLTLPASYTATVGVAPTPTNVTVAAATTPAQTQYQRNATLLGYGRNADNTVAWQQGAGANDAQAYMGSNNHMGRREMRRFNKEQGLGMNKAQRRAFRRAYNGNQKAGDDGIMTNYLAKLNNTLPGAKPVTPASEAELAAMRKADMQAGWDAYKAARPKDGSVASAEFIKGLEGITDFGSLQNYLYKQGTADGATWDNELEANNLGTVTNGNLTADGIYGTGTDAWVKAYADTLTNPAEYNAFMKKVQSLKGNFGKGIASAGANLTEREIPGFTQDDLNTWAAGELGQAIYNKQYSQEDVDNYRKRQQLSNFTQGLVLKKGGTMTNKYQQGGSTPAQSGQDMEAQVTQLVQAAMSGDEQATQTINKIIEAAKAGDQQAMQIAQMIQAVAKQIQGAQAQAAKRGAKLDYLHTLVSGCPKGTEAKYFRKGGHICKACVEKTKKAQEGMELPIEKCGGKTKKKYFVGGSTELPIEKCGGKTIKKKCLDGAKVIEEKCGGKAKKKCLNGSEIIAEKCGGKTKKKCLNGAEIVENKCGGKAKKKKCLDGAKVTENKCGGKTKKKCLNGGILTIEALQAAYKSLNA